jgi:hypothetical protein
MPKFITAIAVAAGLSAGIAIAAASATAANAQTWFPVPNSGPIHDPGGVLRLGNLCWVDTDSYREIDVHGYWRACEPGTFGMRPALAHHHRMSHTTR